MFIKPIDAASINNNDTWQEHAGNLFFSLQARKSNAVRNLFSLATSLATSLSDTPKKVIESDYRIIFRSTSKKTAFIVAVADSFEKMRNDWIWVEQNLTLKLASLDLSFKNPSEAMAFDTKLLQQFEDMSFMDTDSKLGAQKLEFEVYFPSFREDVLLGVYNCSYFADELNEYRGRLFVAKSMLGFVVPSASNKNFLVPYKDVSSVNIVPSKHLLSPECISVMVEKTEYIFSMNVHRALVYRLLCYLCDLSMNKLIKGAETVALASEGMTNQVSNTGDLSNNVQSKGQMYSLTRSIDDMTPLSPTIDHSDSFGDMTDMLGSPVTSPTLNSSTPDMEYESLVLEEPLESDQMQFNNILSIKPLSLEQWTTVLKNLEFQRLFNLSKHEEIRLEESNISMYQRTIGNFVTGSLYISDSHVNFVSLAPSTNKPSNDQPSFLFEGSILSHVQFSIPFSHLVAVSKQPSLPPNTRAPQISLSGYLSLSTRKKQEVFFSFSGVKIKDRVADYILSQMKSIKMDHFQELNVGKENIYESEHLIRQLVKEKVSNRRPVNMDDYLTVKNTPMNRLIASVSAVVGSHEDKACRVLLVPLQALFDSKGELADLPEDAADYSNSEKKVMEDHEKAWSDYFVNYGNDVCWIQHLTEIRKLLKTFPGVHSTFRGDFWMLACGAWHTRPEPGYYENILKVHLDKISPFAEEIEKDVRRSCPEHPAYQSNLGIDALRRVLTAFSWRNPAIGYAQALNIISAVLLLHLKEEDAFWVLCKFFYHSTLGIIVERMLPDHYTKTLVGSVVDQHVFTALVDLHLPQLSAHMKKNYMDLATYAVPWFVCLFLNTVRMKTAKKILDGFFLDGPIFLFWFALGLLKYNEEILLKKRDDEVFMNALKRFFTALDADSGEDVFGDALFSKVIDLAYGQFAPMVTLDVVDALRMKHRLSVVHKMETSYKNSQIRTLQEQVGLSTDEIEILYDEVRKIEFEREPSALTNQLKQTQTKLIEMGGWGLLNGFKNQRWIKQVKKLHPTLRIQGHLPDTITGGKNLSLEEFQRVFPKVSPWRTGSMETKHHEMSLTDRIYHYCSFQHLHAQLKKKNLEGKEIGLLVDLSTLTHILDMIMKQPLQTKLRFLFDIHDIDGDGYLNEAEIKATQDSLLDMFEKVRNETSEHVPKSTTNEEFYLKAVSTFLSSALKMVASNKDLEDRQKSGGFKGLSFNEFLLSMLSQSIFVDYFERIWSISKSLGGQILVH